MQEGKPCGNNECPYNEDTACPAADGCAGHERMEYCCTCHWYDAESGVCCNGYSDYVAEFRCLDDACESWEVKEDE